MRVYKYPLTTEDEIVIQLPEGGEILLVAIQNNVPCLWAKVDPLATPVPRRILMRGTGHDINESISTRYISTIFIDGGTLVFHFFEAL